MDKNNTCVNIKFTHFISGLGTCMDIRYIWNDIDVNVFIPLKSIRYINADRDVPEWTDIIMRGGELTIPMKYEDLIKRIEDFDLDSEPIEEQRVMVR